MKKQAATTPRHLLLRLAPLQRVVLSLTVSAIVFLLLNKKELPALLVISICWVAFAAAFILTSWFVFFKLPVDEIIRKANKEDGSRLFVLFFILLSCFGSMFTVLLLMTSKKMPEYEVTGIVVSVLGMMLSWTLVHTIFAFHYARLYYFQGKDDTPGDETLEFPGKQKPDYIDFAYFSFVIGMTFQVSDVEINSRITRRTVLAHSLLSFALNTFVVALTINLIAGLKN